MPEEENFSNTKMVIILLFFFLTVYDLFCCPGEPQMLVSFFSRNRKQNGVSKHDDGQLDIVLIRLSVTLFLAILFDVYNGNTSAFCIELE